MPEFRWNPLDGRWTIVATERANRPNDFNQSDRSGTPETCPFCPGEEASTPPELFAIREEGTDPDTKGWSVRVVPNKFPALSMEGNLEESGGDLTKSLTGIGDHEVIIESATHDLSLVDLSPEQVTNVLWAYRERLAHHKNRQTSKYGLIFKNFGAEGGASRHHIHSQLLTLPFVPRAVEEKITRARDYYKIHGECLFCAMISQELKEDRRVISKGTAFSAFVPFAARLPYEIWVLPRSHNAHFSTISRKDLEELVLVLLEALSRMDAALDSPPFNLLLHTAPFGLAGSTEDAHYHWHIEILPRIKKIGGYEFATDCYINTIPPEASADHLRKALEPQR